MEEVWRPVFGHEEAYEVSSIGRVKAIARVTCAGHRRRERILKLSDDTDGRLRVTLYKDGVRHAWKVHRLVLFAFKGPPPEGTEACHGDGDHLNNRVLNLRWDTHAANKQDSISHGTWAHGERQGHSKLTPKDVLEIRSSPLSLREAGIKWKVSSASIWNVRHLKSWAHIAGPS